MSEKVVLPKFDLPGKQIHPAVKLLWMVGGSFKDESDIFSQLNPFPSSLDPRNYMGFGTRSSSFLGCGLATCGIFSAKANVQDVLVGVNYKF